MDSSIPPLSASEMPSAPTQEFRSIQGHLPTPWPPITTPAPASVWDDENISETTEQAEQRAMVEEVHKFFCALCARWHTTMPKTVRATVARSADYLRLDIFLGIAISNEGHINFLERTILGAHGLLTTISMGVTMTMTSTVTENNEATAEENVEDPDDLVPVFVGIPDREAQEVTLPDGRVVTVVRLGSTT
ncbi:hypothetical protein Moror_14370 [Moniliophthora roreri MCA 2997]|uniref:Uncharacterized protein n=2 Tax=Moniliophthora roreri TaxID=221103 RepID=V2W6U8_MONRO|nr:hypothetical protein Moror_14370 [Moniliophthora roreri MCA 2997]